MPAETILSGSYDYRLVALSVLIAILASYAALDLGGRVTASAGRRRFTWLTCGAVAMGMGIWAMHYIGMLAYSLPVPVFYDWPTVLLSLLAAILASAIALFVVSRQDMPLLSIGSGGLLMGGGIASMHYIGMHAMRMSAMCRYSTRIVILSVVIAVVISLLALWFTFHLRSDPHSFGWRKPLSALLMGSAIPVMHYTGMAAVTFQPATLRPDLSHAVAISSLGIVGIGSVSLVILTLAILTSLIDRRFAAQALQLHQSEQRYGQLVESAKAILWRAAATGGAGSSRFNYVNREAEELLGYPPEHWIVIPDFWMDHLHPEDRAAVGQYCRAAAQGGEPQQFEHRMIAADKHYVWFRTSVRLMVGDEVSGPDRRELVGVMTDISDRKRAEEAAAHASRAKSRLLAEIERLNQQLRSENTRMSAELEVTQRLQQMMLPREEDLRKIPDLDISGFMHPAAEVGGDYYDVVSQDQGVVFSIGDVTGHGLESGVVAIMVQTAVRTLLASGHRESHKFFEVLNRVVRDNVRLMNCDRNLTFSLLQYQDRTVTISGQHEEVLVVRGNGVLERHDTLNLGFPLGLEENISRFVAESRVLLESGDVLVLYTDGITEAVNRAGAAFGIERLSEALRTSHHQPAHGICEAVRRSLREYTGEQDLLDDISLLVIKPA